MSTRSTRGRMSSRALAVFTASFFTILAAYSIRYSYGTLMPEMLPDLHINKAQAGSIYTSYFFAYTLFSPIVGRLSDRYDTRILISLFMAVMGVGTFLMQFADSLWQASLFFGIAGLGCAACWAPVAALVQRWTNPSRRGSILAFVDAGSTIGVMAAGAVIPLLVSRTDWHVGWEVLGIFGLLLAIANFVLIRDRPTAHDADPSQGPGDHSAVQGAGLGPAASAHPAAQFTYRRLFSDRRFWFIGLAYLLVGVSIQIPFSFLSTYAVQELQVPYGTATSLITVIGIAGLVGKLTLGPLSDKKGRISIMMLASFAIMIGCTGFAFGHSWVLFVMACIFGVGYGACWSMYAACAADYFSKAASGAILGLWTVYLGAGLIIAPVIAGWTADASGTLKWAFIIAAAAGLGTVMMLTPMLRKQPA
jgi:OFA family oxalate/formate antiporter-like MFS transporter